VRGTSPLARVLAAAALLAASACGRGGPGEGVPPPGPAPEPPTAADVPRPELSDMEPRVQYILRDAQQRVLADLANPDEWGRYAMILDAHEVHAAAIPAYGVAQRLAPRDFRWKYLLARVLELQEFEQIDLGAVEKALLQARELNQVYAPLHVRLGNLYVQQGRFGEARDAYTRAVDLEPDSVAGVTGLVRSLLSLGETDAALARIEPFAANHPESWEVQLLLARTYAVAGRREEARRVSERASRLPQSAEYPDPVVGDMMNYAVSATACYKRARALAAQGDFENAAMNLKVVVEVRPDYAAAHERLAWCYLNLDKPKAARRECEKAIELAPRMKAAHEGLARALDALGLPDEAALARAESRDLQDEPETP